MLDDDFFPIHPALCTHDDEKLTLEYWRARAMFADLADRYAETMVRLERNKRIDDLLLAKGYAPSHEEHMRRFHGLVNTKERGFWEELSGQKAILFEC